MDAKEKHRIANLKWAAKHRAEKRAYDKAKYERLKALNLESARLERCTRCAILLKYGGIGDSHFCEGCLNELGIL